MPRKKSKKNMYFDMDVQDAIVKYNGTKSTAKKNIIEIPLINMNNIKNIHHILSPNCE